MKKQELNLNSSSFCYRGDDALVYHVGEDRIRLFSTLEGFITKETCFKLSKVETQRILLPKYLIYDEEEYRGFATEWKEVDWIRAFYGSGKKLKESLELMKKDLLLLTQNGYDMVDMQYYHSNCDSDILTFDGIDRVKESELTQEKLWRKNYLLFETYIRNLIYNGMSEFELDSDSVRNYLYSSEEELDDNLKRILDSNQMAGKLIREDIKRKCLR